MGGAVLWGDEGGSGEARALVEVTLWTRGLSLPFLILADEATEVEECSYRREPL